MVFDSKKPENERALQIRNFGKQVTAIIAPNLQHWIFVPAAHKLWPDAKVYVTPAACNEDLAEKMPGLDVTVLVNGVVGAEG